MYYVYAYLRKSDLTPYYIGKGKGKRLHEKHLVSVPEDKSRIRILKDNLTEDVAHALEIMWIAFYGRKDNGTGILRNMTDGGEGSAGRVVSEESKKKQVATRRKNGNYVVTDEMKNKISKTLEGFGKGIPKSEEHRKHIAEAKMGDKNPMFGLVPSLEHRTKISNTMSGIPKEQITCPHCNKTGGKPSMIRHHFDNCKQKV
jgi:hypothetical protein